MIISKWTTSSPVRAADHRLRLAALLAALCVLAMPSVAGAIGCMFGPDGRVIHKSPGADCRNVSSSSSRDDESEYGAARVVPDGHWIPLHPGTQRLYDVVLRRGYSPFDRPVQVKEYRGTRHFELVEGPARMGEGAFEERITTRIARDADQIDKTGLDRVFMRRGSAGIHLIASNQIWFGKRRDLAFEAGARLLPARLKAKVPWEAGSFSDREILIEETGEALGLQDLKTPHGRYPRCLVVRYVTDIRSTREDLLGRPKFAGRVVRKVWYARGIGMVKSEEQGSLETYVNTDHFIFTTDDELVLRGIRGQVLPASMAKE